MNDVISKLAEALNIYCFDHIWNEPQNEYRVNAKPHMLETRSISGGFTSNGSQYITLPTTDEPYYVYVLHREIIHGLISNDIPTEQWIRADVLCNDHGVLLDTYLPNGKMIYKANSYIYWKCDGSSAFLVITKKALRAIGVHDEAKNICTTLYRDSDIVNDIKVYSFTTPYIDPSYTTRMDIWNRIFKCMKDKVSFIVYIDGYEKEIKDIGDIPLSSFIDIVIDENVIFEFEIDLSNIKNNVGFFSDKDATYKQLIHIPKELNPDNFVITHNTVEFFIRSNENSNGLYVHRCAERTVTQITHNDFAIPMFVMDAYRDYLETQNVTIRMLVRKHVNDNVLIRDKNYIDLLYTAKHTDDDIISHLLGKTSSKLSFWKASELEKSTYVEMMFDVPDYFTAKNIGKYIEGLGYYHTVSLLCQRIVSTIITDWFTGSLNFPKPYLYSNEDVYPVVYLNEFKLNWDQVIVDNTTPHKVTVGLSPEVYYQIGDKLSVELFIDGINKSIEFTPTMMDHTLVIPYSDYVLIEKIESDYPTVALEQTDKIGYERITNLIGNVVYRKTDTGYELIFGPLMYDRNFIVQSDTTTYRYRKKLDNDMLLGNPLFINLETDTDQHNTVPVMETSYIGVWLNNRYLIPNLDYVILENKDTDGLLTSKQLIIQNMEYLKESSNYVEVFVSSTSIDNETHGFVINDRADTENDDITIYFENLTSFHVGGRFETFPEYRGAYFVLPEGKYPTGLPFHVRTSVPKPVKQFLDSYHTNDDLPRIKILNEYFYNNIDDRPKLIILPMESYRIFSIHMTLLVRDIMSGKFTQVVIDPDVSKLKHLIKDYQKFYDIDICHTEMFNKHFLDVYPHYRNFEISDITKLKFISDLISLLLPKDKITSGRNVY